MVFERDAHRLHLRVNYNDTEYTRLRAPWTQMEYEQKVGPAFGEHIDQELAAQSRLLDPLIALVEKHFGIDYSCLEGDRLACDIVIGIPKNGKEAFLTDARQRFPTYSFLFTIDPNHNIAKLEILESY